LPGITTTHKKVNMLVGLKHEPKKYLNKSRQIDSVIAMYKSYVNYIVNIPNFFDLARVS
jgi:hypothetical protein